MVIANGVPGSWIQDLDACECYSLKVQFVWKASEVFNQVCIYFFSDPYLLAQDSKIQIMIMVRYINIPLCDILIMIMIDND